MTSAIVATSGTGSLLSGSERGTGTLDTLRQAWGRWRSYRTTLEELGSLTDRQLGDLGMTRTTLRSFAHGTVYGH